MFIPDPLMDIGNRKARENYRRAGRRADAADGWVSSVADADAGAAQGDRVDDGVAARAAVRAPASARPRRTPPTGADEDDAMDRRRAIRATQRARSPSLGLAMPDLEAPALRALADDEERLRARLELDAAIVRLTRPADLPADAFDGVHGFLDALAIAAADGAAFDPEAMLRRRATGWHDTRVGSAEHFLDVYAREHAAPVDEPDVPPGLAAVGRPQPAPDRELAADALEATAMRLAGPATRLRRERGYLGTPQRSPFLAGPRAGAADLPAHLADAAAWVASAADRPLLAAAVVYARLLGLHPLRDANRRLASWAADRSLRRVPGASTARTGLGRALAARESDERRRLQRLFTTGDWAAWVAWFLETIDEAQTQAKARRDAYRRAFRAFADGVRAERGRSRFGRRRVPAARLAAAAARSPYLSIGILVRAGIAQRVTAGRYLDGLVQAGLGVATRVGRQRVVRVSALADAVLLDATPAHARRAPATRPRRPADWDRLVAAARALRPIDPHDA